MINITIDTDSIREEAQQEDLVDYFTRLRMRDAGIPVFINPLDVKNIYGAPLTLAESGTIEITDHVNKKVVKWNPPKKN